MKKWLFLQPLGKDLGFLITEQVITTDDDEALFYNQGSSQNFASPGAARYRIRLSLTYYKEKL